MPTNHTTFAALGLLVLAAATLYSSGGHAGASAYLALMALFGVSADVMKPTALIIVAGHTNPEESETTAGRRVSAARGRLSVTRPGAACGSCRA
jgi:hypothetical protein